MPYPGDSRIIRESLHVCLGTGHLLEGGGGELVQMGWGYTFCAPENGGLHKIVQPFLRGMYFCALHFPFHKKETTVEESNISYFQNDGITNQHNMVYSSPFTLQKKLHVLLSIT